MRVSWRAYRGVPNAKQLREGFFWGILAGNCSAPLRHRGTLSRQEEARERERIVFAPAVATGVAASARYPELPTETPCFRIDRFTLDIPDPLPATVKSQRASALPMDRFACAPRSRTRYGLRFEFRPPHKRYLPESSTSCPTRAWNCSFAWLRSRHGSSRMRTASGKRGRTSTDSTATKTHSLPALSTCLGCRTQIRRGARPAESRSRAVADDVCAPVGQSGPFTAMITSLKSCGELFGAPAPMTTIEKSTESSTTSRSVSADACVPDVTVMLALPVDPAVNT